MTSGHFETSAQMMQITLNTTRSQGTSNMCPDLESQIWQIALRQIALKL